ncbi:MAG: hypothetical protein EAZ95_04405 [Bacteroidetes bacterium]|nr:MAG: hypothetical protein EAZ95_04405 [Bacteroidota bacterium]
MNKIKIILICTFLLIVASIPIGIFLSNHYILLKYLGGAARSLGRPIEAKVYTNGKLNNDIQVFRANYYWRGGKANYLILFGKEKPIDTDIIGVDLNEKYAFTTSSSHENDYELIWGRLYQSEVGGQLTPFKDGAKGFGFDEKLKIAQKTISFLVPQHEYVEKYNADSIRIELK